MLYQFAPAIEAGIQIGKYLPVISSSGVPLSIARDSVTGRFVAHAIGVASSNAMSINPLIAGPQLLMGAGQMYQNHLIGAGIKSLSASVATLQATTAVIGVGTAVTAALAAVNLWQTLKLRQDVKEMRLEVQEGFLNLHEVLVDQGDELIQHIDQVAEDVEFKHHKTILIRAYGLFRKALNRLHTAAVIQDRNRRSDEIAAARDMLFQALADYDNSQLMQGVCSVAHLRRRECVWAIEQAIIMTYQMQGEFQAVASRLMALDQGIRQDIIKVVSQIKEPEELDFCFPEVTRIHDHDLVTIRSWQEHITWYESLSDTEIQELNSLSGDDLLEADLATGVVQEIPFEYKYYEEIQEWSHLYSLRDSLLVLIDSDTRSDFEKYIEARASIDGFSALTVNNLQKASPLTVANLLHYFAVRDESMQADELDNEA